jgi:hypothetical protein
MSGGQAWSREYQGNQVWKLQVETSQQIHQLASLEVMEYMDFWTEVRKSPSLFLVLRYYFLIQTIY